MSRKLELTFACGDYEIMRALKEGIVRPEGIELTVLTDMGAVAAALALSARARVRHRRSVGLGLCRGARPGSAVPGHSGFPPSPLPPRLHLRQYRQGHRQADRPDRPQGRHQGLSVHGRAVDARHPRARLRRAAQIDRMAERARRGRRFHAAARPQYHAGCRRTNRSRTCWSRARSTRCSRPT